MTNPFERDLYAEAWLCVYMPQSHLSRLRQVDAAVGFGNGDGDEYGRSSFRLSLSFVRLLAGQIMDPMPAANLFSGYP